jgi:hypothetical protein
MGASVTVKRQSATSVSIDPDRVYRFFRARRLPLSVASERLGRNSSFLSVCIHKRRMSFWTLDAIGTEWGFSPGQMIDLIASDEERELQRLV